MFIVEGDENADPIMKISFNEFQNKTSFLKLILRKHSTSSLRRSLNENSLKFIRNSKWIFLIQIIRANHSKIKKL
jgi:hypothetical protein